MLYRDALDNGYSFLKKIQPFSIKVGSHLLAGPGEYFLGLQILQTSFGSNIYIRRNLPSEGLRSLV